MSNDNPSADRYNTEQELFWQGQFGDEYMARNTSEAYIRENVVFFEKVFSLIDMPQSVLEFGPNTGMNLRAISALKPDIKLAGVEINKHAADELAKNLPNANIYVDSFLEFKSSQSWDLVFCKGVLIHIAPDRLEDAYDALYTHSNAYILVAEYYNTSPIEVQYRGHAKKMFKRDFCGEMLDRYVNLKLIDYGFIYHRDPNFDFYDDVTWFLLKKTSGS
tara:strand:+ start:842 stop:1498 length:657 start_codon:yes stop_codon:yes gene_type:complete